MSVGKQLPLGQRIPDSLHAVSVSIPTMADVVGYEEKKPETMAKLTTGYPRFVPHSFLKKIEKHWQRLFETPDSPIWLTSSESMAKQLQTFLGDESTTYLRHRGVSGLRIPSDPTLNAEAKGFLQHIGGFLPTRQAEDYLLLEDLIEQQQPEEIYAGHAAEKLLTILSPLYNTEPESIILTNTGMNAFYSAFCAINEIQSPEGRHSWIKLGWLYTDTMHILDKLGPKHGRNEELLNVFDIDQLERILEKRGTEIAGIVTEAPTNPLIQSMDLARIRDLATKHKIFLVIDPTVASPANVDVSPYADVIVNSLTKYAASEGDIIMGAITVTNACPQKEAFLEKSKALAEAPYSRDLSRIAYQIDNYKSITQQINATAAQVVAYLEKHPKIKKVYWAKEPRSTANFETIARTPDALGGLLSFEYDGPIANFYDRVAIAKGPSFGMTSSLICPYIYLAHYSLVTSKAGLAKLSETGISPELLRFSIGAEPASEIIATLAAALD